MEVLTAVDRDQIEISRARDEFFWLDLKAPSDADLNTAGGLLGLHELALEDTREFNQRPKVDRYPERVLLVYWSARVTANGLGIELVEVHLHISGGFLFTVRRGPCAALDELQTALAPQGIEAEDYILYRVLDGLTDAHYPVVDHLETRIDALEAAVLRNTDRRQLGEIYRLKQEVQLLERRLARSATSSAQRARRSSRCPASRAARASTCTMSPTTSRRSPTSCSGSPTTSRR